MTVRGILRVVANRTDGARRGFSRSNFTSLPGACNARRVMTKRLLALSLLLALIAGCVTNTVTNLTPTAQPRSPTGQYRVEYQWDSTQQTVRWDTIKPVVLVGFDNYEMKPVLRTMNRCGDDEAIRRVGIHWATEQCRDLLHNNVRGLHFYTLNKSDATRQIYENLGVKDSVALRAG